MNPHRQPSISIRPLVSYFDSDLEEIRIGNLLPNTLYKVTLRVQHRGRNYLSHANFTADANGVVDLSRDKPTRGHYYGVDLMGLFSTIYQDSQVRAGSNIFLTPAVHYLDYKLQVCTVTFLFAAAEVIAEKTIRRILLPDGVERVEVRDPVVDGVVFRPKGQHADKVPCLLDMYGMLGMQEHRAALLASKGFYVLALRTHGTKKTPKFMMNVDINYMKAAVNYLVSQPDTTDICGVVGTSVSGHHSMILGSMEHRIKALIIINATAMTNDLTTHLVDGKRYPYHTTNPEQLSRMRFVHGGFACGEADNDYEFAEETYAKVENIANDAKIMIVAGDDDHSVGSIQHMQRIYHRMWRYGRREDATCLVAKGLGHDVDPAFMPIRPFAYSPGYGILMYTGGKFEEGGKEQRRVWPIMIDFLAKHIGRPTSVPLTEAELTSLDAPASKI